MRNRAVAETQRRDPRIDRRGDRTADLTNEHRQLGLGMPRHRVLLIGEAAAGGRPRGRQAGTDRRRFGYSSSLDGVVHLPLCRTSRPNPPTFFGEPLGTTPGRRDGAHTSAVRDPPPPAEPGRARRRGRSGRRGANGSRRLAPECALRKALHITTGDPGPKVDNPISLWTSSRIYYNRGASGESGPPLCDGCVTNSRRRFQRFTAPYETNSARCAACRAVPLKGRG